MVYRNLCKRIGVNRIKQLKEKDADRMFEAPHLAMAAGHSIATIRFLGQRIRSMENHRWRDQGNSRVMDIIQ